MKLHLPLSLRHSVLTLLVTGVPYLAASASAENLSVTSGTGTGLVMMTAGNSEVVNLEMTDAQTLTGNSSNSTTIATRTLTLAEDAILSQTGKIVAEEIILEEGSWLDWRDSGTLESAAVSGGEGEATVAAPARISMAHGSTLSFLHELETNPKAVNLFADVTGNGQVGVGYFLSPAGYTNESPVNVTIEGALQAGDTQSEKRYNGLVVWRASTLTVGTGDWVKGTNSLVLSGDSVIDGTATLNMKYGRLKLTDGASLLVVGTFNYMEPGEGEADDDAYRRTVYLGSGAELTLATGSLTSFKAVDGVGKLILSTGAPEVFEIENDFTGSFKLESGRSLTVAGTTTLNGESSGTDGSVLITGTLSNNADAELSGVAVQTSDTVLGNWQLTLQNSDRLELGNICGDGSLVLNAATANATSVSNSHIHVGDASTFVLSNDEQVMNYLSLSGTGAVVLGNGERVNVAAWDTLVSSSDIDVSSLHVMSDASLELTNYGKISSLTVGDEGYVSIADGTLFSLNTVNSQGTIVLGNGRPGFNDVDTVVSVSQFAENSLVEIREDAKLQLGKDISLMGAFNIDGTLVGTSATIVKNTDFFGSGRLILDSVTINNIANVYINSSATIGKLINNGILSLGDDNLTNGERDVIFDLSGSGESYIIEGGSLNTRRDVSVITGNNILKLTWGSVILGGLDAGEIQLEQGILLRMADSCDLVADKVWETSGKGASLVLGSNSTVEGNQYTTQANITEVHNVFLTVCKDAELTVSALTLKGESYIDGRINGNILTYNGSATISGTGSASFTETLLIAQGLDELTVKNIRDINLGKVYGPTLGRGDLVLGDGESEGGFDTIVTAESMAAYHFVVNSDAKLTTQFLSLHGGTFTINGKVETDYIAPWFDTVNDSGFVTLDAADFEKITVAKGVKLYSNSELNLRNVSLSFGSVEQIDADKSWGTLSLGDGKLTDGLVDTTLSVSGAFDANVSIEEDAALTVANTANLNSGYIYGSLTANNLNLHDGAGVSGTGYLNVTGETTLGEGAKLTLTGSREMNLGTLNGSGTLELGDGNATATTSVTVSSFNGSLNSKSDATLNVTGAMTLTKQSANAGTLQANSLTLSEGAVLNNSGTIVTETGVISLNTGSTLALTGSLDGLQCSVSGTGTLQVGDGDDEISTTADLSEFRGLLDIKSDGSLTTTTTTLISVQTDENTLVADSFIGGSLTTQNLDIVGKVNLSGEGAVLVQGATKLDKDASLTVWGSELINLGVVSGTGGSSLAVGATGATTSAAATSFNCSDLYLAGDTTFTVSGDFNASVVDMGAEAGATLHVQNGAVSMNEIGNAYGLQTGTLILGDGERLIVTEAQGDTPAVTEADTIATVESLNLASLELKADATLAMAGNGDFKTGSLAMEAGALLDLTTSGPIVELGKVTGNGKIVLGAERRATASSFESDLDIGAGATMTVDSSYTGALNIADGASLTFTKGAYSSVTLTGASTNQGTLTAGKLILKNGATLSGDGYLVSVNNIELESGTRLNLTNSNRPEGSVIGGFEPDTFALNTISGKGAFVMYGSTKVMVDAFSGCLGMRTGSTLIVDGKTTLSGVGAGYGTLVTRELIIAEKSGFETHYESAIPTSYDYDGESSNPAVALTLNLEAGSYLHMYKTGMQDFLDSMTNASITLNTDSVFYGHGNLHIDQGILDKFALLEGKIQVSGILSYDSNLVLTGCEGLFEGGVTDPSTAEVYSGDASGDIGGDNTGGERPEAQEVTDDVADEIVQEEINDGVDPGPDTSPDPGPEIDPGPGEGGGSAGEVIGTVADATLIASGVAGIVTTGLQVYGKVKAAKYAAIVTGIGITGGVLTKIILTVTEDDDDGDDDDDDDDDNNDDDNRTFSIIESEEPLTIINSAIVTGDSKVLDSIVEKTRELQESGKLEDFGEYIISLEGNTAVEIKEQLAAWFPEFSELTGGELCISAPETTITGSVILGGDDITFKGYSDREEDLANFDLMGDSLTFNRGSEARSTKIVAKDTLRLRAFDIDVLEGSILAAPDVDIKAETLEVSGDSYIISTQQATFDISDSTTVTGSTVYLRGVTDGSTLGALAAREGAQIVLDGSASSTVGANSVLLEDSNMTVKNMNAVVSGGTTVRNNATLTVDNATYSTSSMEVGSGAALINNNGTISSTVAIVLNDGSIQGSGTFSAMTMEHGKLVVGNSPGLQVYTGNVELKEGDVIFSLSNFNQSATAETQGWDSAAYSVIDMNGHNLTISKDVSFTIEIGGEALDLLMAPSTGETVSFSLELFRNVDSLTLNGIEIADLIANTEFVITSDEEGLLDGRYASFAGLNITENITSAFYTEEYGKVVLNVTIGSVPEPSTATLSLLALAALAARRRRK